VNGIGKSRVGVGSLPHDVAVIASANLGSAGSIVNTVDGFFDTIDVAVGGLVAAVVLTVGLGLAIGGLGVGRLGLTVGGLTGGGLGYTIGGLTGWRLA